MKCVTVMCDYCADGLWEDGVATNLEFLLDSLNLDFNEFTDLDKEITEWQNMYEDFDLWSDQSNNDEFYNSDEFKKFLELGEKIAFKIRKIVPEDIEVIYFKEGRPSARYYVHDKTMTLKEKYD